MMAKTGKHAATIRELVDNSGLSIRTIIRLSKRRSWDNVPVSTASSFISACGLNFDNMSAHVKELESEMRRGPRAFSYIKSPKQKRYFMKLIA